MQASNEHAERKRVGALADIVSRKVEVVAGLACQAGRFLVLSFPPARPYFFFRYDKSSRVCVVQSQPNKRGDSSCRSHDSHPAARSTLSTGHAYHINQGYICRA